MLLQHGKLCTDCGDKCVDCPSKSQPTQIQCVSCAGMGCGDCDNGYWNLTRCPKLEITPDLVEIIHYAELYEKGIPPLAGGALDQAKAFTDACRHLWADQARLKAESGMLFHG